jgi:hypothetical protein
VSHFPDFKLFSYEFLNQTELFELFKQFKNKRKRINSPLGRIHAPDPNGIAGQDRAFQPTTAQRQRPWPMRTQHVGAASARTARPPVRQWHAGVGGGSAASSTRIKRRRMVGQSHFAASRHEGNGCGGESALTSTAVRLIAARLSQRRWQLPCSQLCEKGLGE